MDDTHFDALTRTVSRRTITTLGVGGLSTILGLAATDTAARKKREKKCPPCRLRNHGKCKTFLADDTPCFGGGRCLAGACNPAPNCVATGLYCYPSPFAIPCCDSGTITTCDGVTESGFVCSHTGGAGALCQGAADCTSGRCVGYRCQ